MLGEALLPERDLQFSYLGLQTLYDRYFIHSDETRFELPQLFFMRVAMGLATREDDKNARAIEFYQLLSSFDYMSSTPTLFNSGTLRPQLSSCYLTTVPDDLPGIYGAIQDNLEEHSDLSALVVYPNPTQGLISINGSLDQAAPVAVRIVNYLGQVISADTFDAQPGTFEKTYDLSAAASGTYVVEIETPKGLLQKTVVVRH